MLPSFLLEELVLRALAEDVASGDLTTHATVSADARGIARAVARSPLVVCGGEIFAKVFYAVDRGLRVEQLLADGAQAQPSDPVLLVEGATRSILIGERTALNFLQRLSGIATLTRRYVDSVPAGKSLRICDTRKTTPGLRALERYAVRTGGGKNHRNDLGSAVLIKDNHIVAAGGIAEAVERARRLAPHTSRIEVEVESLAELDQALVAGAEIVLLDNFADAELEEAVSRAHGKAIVEVSGGVTLARIERLANAGIDVASVGALTHSAPASDISLDLESLS